MRLTPSTPAIARQPRRARASESTARLPSNPLTYRSAVNVVPSQSARLVRKLEIMSPTPFTVATAIASAAVATPVRLNDELTPRSASNPASGRTPDAALDRAHQQRPSRRRSAARRPPSTPNKPAEGSVEARASRTRAPGTLAASSGNATQAAVRAAACARRSSSARRITAAGASGRHRGRASAAASSVPAMPSAAPCDVDPRRRLRRGDGGAESRDRRSCAARGRRDRREHVAEHEPDRRGDQPEYRAPPAAWCRVPRARDTPSARSTPSVVRRCTIANDIVL